MFYNFDYYSFFTPNFVLVSSSVISTLVCAPPIITSILDSTTILDLVSTPLSFPLVGPIQVLYICKTSNKVDLVVQIALNREDHQKWSM